MGDGMRLDRYHLAARADVARERKRIGADIGADIDEHAARRGMRPQKVQLSPRTVPQHALPPR